MFFFHFFIEKIYKDWFYEIYLDLYKLYSHLFHFPSKSRANSLRKRLIFLHKCRGIARKENKNLREFWQLWTFDLCARIKRRVGFEKEGLKKKLFFGSWSYSNETFESDLLKIKKLYWKINTFCNSSFFLVYSSE